MSNIRKTKKNFVDSEMVNNFTPEQKKTWDDMWACRDEIEKILKTEDSFIGKGYWALNIDVPIAAYLIAKACDCNNPHAYKIKDDETLDLDIAEAAEKSGIQSNWKQLADLTTKYGKNIFILVALIKEVSDPIKTPLALVELAMRLLEIKEGETFADFCCRTGQVATKARKENSIKKICAFDTDVNAIALAKIYDEFEETEISYYKQDVFELGINDNEKTKYDKIFSNYPFGLKQRDLKIGKDYLKELEKRIPSVSKATSSDWLFNSLIVDKLSKKGRAVCIMTNGSTWNMIDAQIRKYFVENGLIECVISLPVRVFPNMSVATSMIVFSHNNKGVRLVDASEWFVPGRRVDELDDEIIERIIEASKEEGENSKLISTEMLRENEYVLSLGRYKVDVSKIKDGIHFESVIKRITRGAGINAKGLDALISQVPTDMQYLMLSNIHDGVIDNDLPYIKEIEKKNEKYCLSNHCLILSKNGYPYKVAVAEVKEGQKILANGNLYIVELDEQKVNPYYLAAFFGSEQGTAALKSITVGATIPNIGVEQLRKLIIPIPSLKEQEEIVKEYKTIKDEIVMLQLKLDKAKNRLAHIIEEGGNV